MSITVVERDPVSASVRKARARRRVGENASCACGETQPELLIRRGNSVMCVKCTRKRAGKRTTDKHHPAGRNNDPSTVEVDVNDHRAVLSVAQHDWPRKTLENPRRSPLLRAAASVRGFVDMVIYWVTKLLLWSAEMLENLDELLEMRLGPRWWVGTPIANFAPKDSSRA